MDFEIVTCPLSLATLDSIPVPTKGDWGLINGTAWRCIFEPISALGPSLCSRKGISEVETLTSCIGETSIYLMFSGISIDTLSPNLVSISLLINWPNASIGELA